ncbi:MAG TPA: ATP-binding protein, partial [Micromonosporaceae bacterium]|nr:ATP-binding protein [Micromonosporaceae bacterium]
MVPHDQLRRMRSGVRSAVVRAGGTMRGAARPALLTVLCAGALAPVVVAAVGSGVVAVAGIGVVGGMAGNVLSNVISSMVDRLRRDGPRSPADVERELTAQIEAVLAGDPETADELRQEIADLLRQIGAVHHAVEAAVEIDDEGAQSALIAAFGDLADQFAEFRFVLTDIRVAADQLQQRIYREDAERRADRDRNRQQATQLQLIHEQLAAIERNTRTRERDGVAGPRGRWQDDSPYRGLAPFLENEAEVFYGRDRLTAELTTRVGQCAFGTGLLVVTGPSGAGKSSLLRAGLFPAIARGVLPAAGSEHWPRLVMTPGTEPLNELAAHIAAVSGVAVGSVQRELVAGPGSARLLARQAVLAHAATLPMGQRATADGRLVVVVDQFEELFTLTDEKDSEEKRRTFIAALRSMSRATAGDTEPPAALVIVAVRGDFFDRCASYPEFVDSLRDGPFVVGPMTEGELRQAIIGPAVAGDLELDDGLADAILADLRNTPADRDFAVGALPLLSQTMLLTWQHRDGDRLTHRGYGLTGGVANVVETSAEEVHEALTPTQQRTARDMFRRLTTVTREGLLARQPVDRAALRKAASSGDAAQTDAEDAVLDAFTAKRLIVVADEHAEIAHDAVLRAWPRLRSWFDDDQAGRILYSQLIEDAADWQSHERDPSFLYR